MTGHQRKHIFIQSLRHCVQALACVLVITLVYLSLYAHYRSAKAIEDDAVMTGFKGAVLTQIEKRVAQMDDPQAFLDGNKGTFWSMKVGGVDLTDPLAAAEMTATSKRIHVPLLLSILIPVIVTLLLGRVFCSWICPAGLLFEMTDKLRKLVSLAELKPAAMEFSHANKYILLTVGLLISAAVGLPFFALIYPPAVMSRLAHAAIFGTALTSMLILLGIIVVFEVFISPRWWCRTMCPGGALYGLLGWRRLLRVKLSASRCTGCRDCEPICPMGLYPVKQSAGIECDNCGLCLRHCPEDALGYAVSRRSSWRSAGKESGQQEVAAECSDAAQLRLSKTSIITVLICLLFPATVSAHHILGLPHYSYKDNYPQAPTLEYPATTGPYDPLLTSYPGNPVPNQRANLAFYIKDRHRDTPYDRPVSVRVLKTSTFGRNHVIVPASAVEPFDQLHKLAVQFPDDGEYIVELTMQVEGQAEVIPFLMVAGKPSASRSVIIAVVISLALFVVIVRTIKIKRDRHLGRAAEGS